MTLSTKIRLSLSAALIAVAATATTLTIVGTGSGSPPGLSRVSAQGTPVAFSPAVVAKLHLGDYRAISLLGSRGQERFYRLDNDSPAPCFATGRADAPYPIGSIACRIADPYFPSPAKPILDLSSIEVDPATNQAHFTRIEGVAADAVTSVRLLAKEGSIIEDVPVSNNLYALDSVPPTAVSLAAVDAGGSVVARVP